jgi:DNA polymerase III gamma/tau subunit
LIASLADHLRNLLIVRTCGVESNLVEVPGLSTDDLAKQAAQFDPVTLSQDIAILEDLRRSLRSTQAGRALLDATLVRLALAEQFASVNELLGRVDGQSAAPRAAVSAPPAALKKNAEVTASHDEPQARDTSNIEPVAIDDLPAVWQAMLQVLSSRSASFLPLIESATLASIDDGVAVLKYPSECDTIVRMLDRNGKKEAIRDALCAILKTSVGLKLEIIPSERAAELEADKEPSLSAQAGRVAPLPAPTPETTTVRITPELRAELRARPLIGAVIEHLGGEIVKVE